MPTEKCNICGCDINVKLTQREPRVEKNGICDYCFHAGRPTHEWDRWRLEMPRDYCEWIYRLVKREKPKAIFEIGLGPGASSVATLLATEEFKTRVVTVDINPQYPRVEVVESICHAKDRWHVECSDSVFYAKHLRYKEEIFNYIYIDGGHSVKCVFADACACYDILTFGGLMVFDDCGTTEFGSMVNEGIAEFIRLHENMEEEFPDLGVINPHGARVFRKLPA